MGSRQWQQQRETEQKCAASTAAASESQAVLEALRRAREELRTGRKHELATSEQNKAVQRVWNTGRAQAQLAGQADKHQRNLRNLEAKQRRPEKRIASTMRLHQSRLSLLILRKLVHAAWWRWLRRWRLMELCFQSSTMRACAVDCSVRLRSTRLSLPERDRSMRLRLMHWLRLVRPRPHHLSRSGLSMRLRWLHHKLRCRVLELRRRLRVHH